MTIKSKTSRAAITTSLLIALLVVISTVPLGVLAQSGGETEPNDARAAATPLKDSISGEIGVSGGADWYSAQFTEGETVSFLVTKSLKEPGLSLTLYGPKGEKLFKDESKDYDRRMQVAVTANYTGTYYINIEAQDDSKKEIPYVVRVFGQTATETPPGEEGEPNDALPAATSLQNKYARSTLSGSGDVDWYSAEFTRGRTASFLITDREKNISNIRVGIYSPNGTLLKKKYVSINDTRVQLAAVARRTGTYHLRIGSEFQRVNSSMAYTIRVPGRADPPEITSPPTTDTVTSQTATLSTTTQTATGTTTTSTATTGTTTAGTATSAQTGTSTSSGTSSSANTPVEEETTSMFGPGFTSVGAIIALLSGVLFTVRRR